MGSVRAVKDQPKFEEGTFSFQNAAFTALVAIIGPFYAAPAFHRLALLGPIFGTFGDGLLVFGWLCAVFAVYFRWLSKAERPGRVARYKLAGSGLSLAVIAGLALFLALPMAMAETPPKSSERPFILEKVEGQVLKDGGYKYYFYVDGGEAPYVYSCATWYGKLCRHALALDKVVDSTGLTVRIVAEDHKVIGLTDATGPVILPAEEVSRTRQWGLVWLAIAVLTSGFTVLDMARQLASLRPRRRPKSDMVQPG